MKYLEAENKACEEFKSGTIYMILVSEIRSGQMGSGDRETGNCRI